MFVFRITAALCSMENGDLVVKKILRAEDIMPSIPDGVEIPTAIAIGRNHVNRELRNETRSASWLCRNRDYFRSEYQTAHHKAAALRAYRLGR